MKYQEVVEKLKTRKYMARLSHWKPDVWISYSQNNCGGLVLTYDDGELFEPTTTEQNSCNWEIINGTSVEEYMRKNIDFAKITTLKVMSMRYNSYIHMLNSRLTELYINNNALAQKGVGYIIVLENGEWEVKMVGGHWNPLTIKANNRTVVQQAITMYESLLNNIGELNLDLIKVRSMNPSVDELIELYYMYK